MSNVIGFLEALGARPPMSAAEYAATVDALAADAGQSRALRARDAATLSTLLGGRAQLWCVVAMPENDEPGESTPDDGDGDGVPNEEESGPLQG